MKHSIRTRAFLNEGVQGPKGPLSGERLLAGDPPPLLPPSTPDKILSPKAGRWGGPGAGGKKDFWLDPSCWLGGTPPRGVPFILRKVLVHTTSGLWPRQLEFPEVSGFGTPNSFRRRSAITLWQTSPLPSLPSPRYGSWRTLGSEDLSPLPPSLSSLLPTLSTLKTPLLIFPPPRKQGCGHGNPMCPKMHMALGSGRPAHGRSLQWCSIGLWSSVWCGGRWGPSRRVVLNGERMETHGGRAGGPVPPSPTRPYQYL